MRPERWGGWEAAPSLACPSWALAVSLELGFRTGNSNVQGEEQRSRTEGNLPLFSRSYGRRNGRPFTRLPVQAARRRGSGRVRLSDCLFIGTSEGLWVLEGLQESRQGWMAMLSLCVSLSNRNYVHNHNLVYQACNKQFF